MDESRRKWEWGNEFAKFSTAFECHFYHTLEVRDEIELWVHENYERWEKTKPEWYTGLLRSKIPDSMKPQHISAATNLELEEK